MGVLTKYGFGLYREIKEMRQKNDGGLTKYGFDGGEKQGRSP